MSEAGGIGGSGSQPNFDITNQGSMVDDEAASSISEEVAGEGSSKTATETGQKAKEGKSTQLSSSSATQQAEVFTQDQVTTAKGIQQIQDVLLKLAAGQYNASSPGLAEPQGGAAGGHGGNVWMQTDAMVGAIVAALSSVRLMAESRREDQALKTDMAIQVAEMKEAAAQLQMAASIDKAEAQIIEGNMQMVQGAMTVSSGVMSGAMSIQGIRATKQSIKDTAAARKLEDTNTRMANDQTTIKNENYALKKAQDGKSADEIKEAVDRDVNLSTKDKLQIKKFMEDNDSLFVNPGPDNEYRNEVLANNQQINQQMDLIQNKPHTEADIRQLEDMLARRNDDGDDAFVNQNQLETNNSHSLFGKDINDTQNLIDAGNSAAKPGNRADLEKDGLAFDADDPDSMPPTGTHADVLKTRGAASQELARGWTQMAQASGQTLSGIGQMFGGMGQIMAGYKNIEAAETQYASDLCRAMADLMEAHLRVIDQDIEDFRQGVNKGLETLQAILSISKSSANMRG